MRRNIEIRMMGISDDNGPNTAHFIMVGTDKKNQETALLDVPSRASNRWFRDLMRSNAALWGKYRHGRPTK